jgi:hypothetical protein
MEKRQEEVKALTKFHIRKTIDDERLGNSPDAPTMENGSC